MNLVGAGFDSDVDDDAGFGAVVGLGLFLGVEFLNSVEREGAGGRTGDAGIVDDGFAVVDVVIVGAVDDEIVVVGAHAVGRQGVEAAAGIALHAGMQGQEILEVATLERQFVDGFVREHAIEPLRTALLVPSMGDVGNFHDFADAAGDESKVDL